MFPFVTTNCLILIIQFHIITLKTHISNLFALRAVVGVVGYVPIYPGIAVLYTYTVFHHIGT